MKSSSHSVPDVRRRWQWVALAALASLAVVMVIVQLWNTDRVPTWPASGRVVFSDGGPVKTGIIELTCEAHDLVSSGRIQEDGTFVLGTYELDDGAPEREHPAIVVQIIIDDGTVQHSRDHGRAVAVRYRKYESSNLVVRIEPRENLKIEVEAEPLNSTGRSLSSQQIQE